MRQIALSIAVASFFVLAFIGWASDVPVFVCGLRAAAGAFVLYIVLNLAATAVIRILVDAALRGEADEASSGGRKS